MKRLEQLRTVDGRQLPPRLNAEIRRELQRLELVLQMIKTIEKERNAMALGKAPSTYGNAKKVQQLVKIGNIGPEIATVLVGEVFFRQFNNRQEVGSYVGLTPSHFQSGPGPVGVGLPGLRDEADDALVASRFEVDAVGCTARSLNDFVAEEVAAVDVGHHHLAFRRPPRGYPGLP
jgi:transposase